MKPFAWIFSLLSLFCLTRIVCSATPVVYPLSDYDEYNIIKNDYFVDKRNKPSLSIVNPLDVLRQRLLLEIARRQMKENTRQVELNRAILKNVGKRTSQSVYRHQFTLLPDNQEQLLAQDSLNKKTPLQLYEFTAGKTSSITDEYQRPPSQLTSSSSAIVTGIEEDVGKNSLGNVKRNIRKKEIKNQISRRNYDTMDMTCADCAPMSSITSGQMDDTTNGYRLPFQLHKVPYYSK